MTFDEIIKNNNPLAITYDDYYKEPIHFIRMKTVNGRARLFGRKAGLPAIYLACKKKNGKFHKKAWTKFSTKDK